ETEKYLNLHKNYISGKNSFPEGETRQKQKLLMNFIDNSSIREYIYSGHSHLLYERSKLSESISLNGLRRCAINFYKVLSVNDNQILGQNLFLDDKRELEYLEGLEVPKVGNIVSGHWNAFLEIVDDWTEFDKYKSIAEKYFNKLK
ncbi:MAG: hypothetical protein OQK82_04795, partial [Candidatus Pacearchaeota archaeon]|nr:hypothetical protein [Candidatus Pacearchaeota archaeon]